MKPARRIHLDHNATTPLRPEARAVFLEALDELGGNPSSLHAAGRRARDRVDRARESVARALGAHEDEIVFTSGGTESNNLALRGALALQPAHARTITTEAEHASVLETARDLERSGRTLTLLKVDARGVPDPASLSQELARGPAALVSVAAANNEVGGLCDLTAFSAVVRDVRGGRPLLHTDAVQALGRIPIRLQEWGFDLATFSAHKVGGPVGVGVLWKRAGVRLASLFGGGEQEGGLRPGTENVAALAGAARAIELAVDETAEFAERTQRLSTALWQELVSSLPDARLLGPTLGSTQRLPNTLNVFLPGTDGKVLVTRLDLEGLEVGAGSACASGSLAPSHVLLAMGLDEASARAGLRLSLGRTTTLEDCKRAVDILCIVCAPSRATRDGTRRL
jgi:cysteine desulfurase